MSWIYTKNTRYSCSIFTTLPLVTKKCLRNGKCFEMGEECMENKRHYKVMTQRYGRTAAFNELHFSFSISGYDIICD